MTPLCALAQKHGTDKFAKHNYTPVYHSLFPDPTAVRGVLEVGIKRGASLRMWAEFFPQAKVFGIDHKPRWLINEGRIASFLGNEENPRSLIEAAEQATKAGPLDLIVDDALHHANYQTSTARTLLPFMAKDGVYVIEDVKNGPRDRPKQIMMAMPAEFHCKLVVTNPANSDSALILIRRKP